MQSSIVDLFLRRHQILIKWLCLNYPFKHSQIEKFKEDLNWYSISSNRNIKWTEAFIDKYKASLSFYTLAKNPSLPWSIEFIDRYPELWKEKENLSGNTGLPWSKEFIENYKHRWNWHWLTMNPGISWTKEMFIEFDLFNENLSEINGHNLWTNEFLVKYADKLNWSHLTYNMNIKWSSELIGAVKVHWRERERTAHYLEVTPWKGLSQNPSIDWTDELIKRYIRKPLFNPYGFHWKELSGNEGLPFQDGILLKYEDKWEWNAISGNNGVRLNREQINKYKDRLNWNDDSTRSLSANKSLEWNEELIEKYKDRWDWFQIGLNEGVTWTDEMIDKYKPYLDPRSFFKNKELTWNLELVLCNDDEVINAWKYLSEDDQRWFFEKIFLQQLNDETVDDILFKLSNPFHLIKQSDIDDEYVRLAQQLLAYDLELNKHYKRYNELMVLNDRILTAITKISVHDRKDGLIVTTFLNQYENWNDSEFNIEVTSILNYFIDELVKFFSQRGDLEYITNVVRKHNLNMKQYDQFRSRGDHVSFDFSYLKECIKNKGQKALSIGRVLVAFEELESYLESENDDLPF